jgi:DNA gyrase subunit A
MPDDPTQDQTPIDPTELPVEGQHIGVVDLEIERELQDSYLTYAMSTIMDRALPDVRDGLKPSQRRILVAMNDLNLRPGRKHLKCAKICGDTSGNYHPHGESVIYPTMVGMAQKWRCPSRWWTRRATSARSTATRRPRCGTPKPG